MVNGEMMKSESLVRRYSGREFGPEELELIREVVESCSGVSRTELANTVCELVGWRRPNGRLKGQECREFLEHLESSGFLVLPRRQKRRPFGSRTHIPYCRKIRLDFCHATAFATMLTSFSGKSGMAIRGLSFEGVFSGASRASRKAWRRVSISISAKTSSIDAFPLSRIFM